jgi:PPOX class probable F420-dependent enzyme
VAHDAAELSDEVEAFLSRARRAHLATSSRAGVPHVVPICFALLDRRRVAFAIDDKPKPAGQTLKRLRNLQENPHFALLVDHWDEDWTQLGYVLLAGAAAALLDAARAAAAVQALRARYPQYVAMDLDAARHAVIELAIERVHVWGRLAP